MLELEESIPENNIVLENILKNIENIKKLEQDNKKLKNLLLKNQDSMEGNLNNKINDLINILNKKEAEFLEYKNKIKQNHEKLIINFNEYLNKEKQKNKLLKTLLPEFKKVKLENTLMLKKHAKLKYILKKDFEKRISKINDEYKINKVKHQSILKDFEKDKLNFNSLLEEQKQKNLILREKYIQLRNKAEEIEAENKKIKFVNKKLVDKINYLHENTLGNDKKLAQKSHELKNQFEIKLKNMAKQFLEKEIEYKTRIDSLNFSLKKYFTELKELKQKYYNREEELKNKLNKLNGLFH